MLYAYLDESYNGDIRATLVYVVAGFIGQQHQWHLFERLWRESMRSLGIEGVGFHANACANGARPYDIFTAAQRGDIQERLIIDIVAAKLFGVVSCIDMPAYLAHKGALRDTLALHDRHFNEAPVLAVRQCVQQMCLETEHETTEPITFAVDQNHQFGKRAEQWYETSAKSTDPLDRHRNRLGPYSQGKRDTCLGLQAADLLAYAALRHEIGKPAWQWGKLLSGHIIGRPFTTSEPFRRQIELESRELASANAKQT